jgi:long-chain-fatty-acid--CoA ligase ACSBG
LQWNELLEIGKKESDDKLLSVLKTIGVNECCTLVYTVCRNTLHISCIIEIIIRYTSCKFTKHITFLQSGTVGNPKAVMLSHDNLLHDVRLLLDVIEITEKSDTIISYLPLSHVAAQVRLFR